MFRSCDLRESLYKDTLILGERIVQLKSIFQNPYAFTDEVIGDLNKQIDEISSDLNEHSLKIRDYLESLRIDETTLRGRICTLCYKLNSEVAQPYFIKGDIIGGNKVYADSEDLINFILSSKDIEKDIHKVKSLIDKYSNVYNVFPEIENKASKLLYICGPSYRYLYGPELNSESYLKLEDKLTQLIEAHVKLGITDIYTDGTQGIGTLAFDIVQKLKLKYNLKCNLAIPYKAYNANWTIEEKKKMDERIKLADKVVLVADIDKYHSVSVGELFEKSIQYMIDTCQYGIFCSYPNMNSLIDNATLYALKNSKNVYRLNPSTYKISKLK